jgi:hypothetical protein
MQGLVMFAMKKKKKKKTLNAYSSVEYALRIDE